MAEPKDTPPKAETAMQRALRLKKAAIESRRKPPPGGRFERETAAQAAKSKPWMKR